MSVSPPSSPEDVIFKEEPQYEIVTPMMLQDLLTPNTSEVWRPPESSDANSPKHHDHQDENSPDILEKILDVLQRSTIANRDTSDPQQRFWKLYRATADEFDSELLAKYGGDLDASMIFAGLFSAVAATVLTMTNSNLSQDPNSITQALLQSVVNSLNTSATSSPLVPTVPIWTGPSSTTIWVQCLLYVSLACSLFAALAAVLGKQWLSYYRSVGERGDNATRAMERHRKFVGLETWHLRTILEMIPVLLQLSLLLFGFSICAYVWNQQRVVGAVAIIANGAGAASYIAILVIPTLHKDSPFQTPLSALLSRLARSHSHSSKSILPSFQDLSSHTAKSIHAACTSLRFGVHVMCASVLSFSRQFACWLRSFSWLVKRLSCQPSRTSHLPPEPDVELPSLMLELNLYTLPPDLVPSEDDQSELIPTDEDEALTSAVQWLLNTSTEVEVEAEIWRLIPTIPWSSRALQQLPFSVLDRILADILACYTVYTDSLGAVESLDLLPGRHEASLSAILSFLFLVWEKIADDYENTKDWIYKSTTTGIFTSLTVLRHPLGAPYSNLDLLNELLIMTVKHFQRFARQLFTGTMRNHCLLPITSIRSHSCADVAVISTRTTVYLAQQVRCSSSTDSDRTPAQDVVPLGDWNVAELAAYQKHIFSLCRRLCRLSEHSLHTHVLTLLAFLLATNENLKFPARGLPSQQGSTDVTTSLAILAFSGVYDIMRKLEDYLRELPDKPQASDPSDRFQTLSSFKPLLRAIAITDPTQTRSFRSGAIASKPSFMSNFVRPLLLLPDIWSALRRRHPDDTKQQVTAQLVELYEDALPAQCFSTLVMLSHYCHRSGSDINGNQKMLTQLLLHLSLGERMCCPMHIWVPFTERAFCEGYGTKEWIPRHLLVQKLLDLDQQTLCVFVEQLFSAHFASESYTDPYRRVMLLSCIPMLGHTIRANDWFFQYAIGVIRGALQRPTDNSFRDARSAACLIHALLRPLPDGQRATSPQDLITSLQIHEWTFHDSMCALLRQSCDQSFYRSAYYFRGPDETATDIMLWLGGLSLENTQCRRGYISLWWHIVQRAHTACLYLCSEYWVQPSNHLQTNLWSLLSVAWSDEEPDFDDGGTDDDDDANGRIARRQKRAWTRSGYTRKAAVSIIELQLLRWTESSPTIYEPTPISVLGFAVGALAQCFAHIRQSPYYSTFKADITFFRDSPDFLLVRDRDEVEDEKHQCGVLLELLLAMLTPLPEPLLSDDLEAGPDSRPEPEAGSESWESNPDNERPAQILGSENCSRGSDPDEARQLDERPAQEGSLRSGIDSSASLPPSPSNF